MFLDSLRKTDLTEWNMEACTYPAFYRYWTESLFERITRLFVWENTGSLDPKEIEERCILQGFAIISQMPKEKELTAFFGSMFGPTKYYDEFKQVNINCPIYSGTRTIGRDAVIINNSALRNPSYMYVHHYATMLAHAEVTLIDMLVEARDSGGVPIVKNEKQLQSVRSYLKKRFIGKVGDAVTDSGFMGIDFAGSDRKTSQDIQSILETRNKLLRCFYSDIGVRSTFEKRSNVNSMEIDGDTSMLLLNVSDMIRQREKAAEEVNSLYGTNWSVHIAEEIDYEKENEAEMMEEVTDDAGERE